MALDQHQRAAIEAICALPTGILRVEAAAGSGKTRTAVAAVATLLRRGLCTPERMRVLTFTKDAAEDLRGRFKALGWGPKALPQIGTYHSLARRALGGGAWPMDRCVDVGGKEQKVPAAYSLWERIVDKGRIYPTNLQGLEILDALEKRGLKPHAYGTVIGALRGFGATPDDWTCASALARATADELPQLRAVWRKYEEVKRIVGGWDFEDLLEAWESHLRRHGGDMDVVLVDEAQDNTPRQNAIAVGLVRDTSGGCGLVVRVGDKLQAIYGFRGSSPEHFDAPQGPVPLLPAVRLPTNYRSSPEIVGLGNLVVPAQAVSAPDAVAGRVWGLRLASASAAPGRLAEELRERPAEEWDQWAVLCRTNAEAHRFAAALVMAGVPARGFGGVPAQVLTLASYIQVLHPPAGGCKPAALTGAASWPRRYWSRQGLAVLKERAAAMNAKAAEAGMALPWETMRELILSSGRAADGGKLGGSQTRAAEALVVDLERLRSVRSLVAQTRAIAKLCCPALDAETDGATAAAGLDDEEAVSGWRLGVEMMADAVREALAPPTEAADGAVGATAGLTPHAQALAGFRRRVRALGAIAETGVTVSTIHAAKGLEYDRVALFAGEGTFPRSGDRIKSPAARAAYLAEEHRLLYVAITRARCELLLLTAPPAPPRGGGDAPAAQIADAVRLDHAGVAGVLRALVGGWDGVPRPRPGG